MILIVALAHIGRVRAYLALGDKANAKAALAAAKAWRIFWTASCWSRVRRRMT